MPSLSLLPLLRLQSFAVIRTSFLASPMWTEGQWLSQNPLSARLLLMRYLASWAEKLPGSHSLQCETVIDGLPRPVQQPPFLNTKTSSHIRSSRDPWPAQLAYMNASNMACQVSPFIFLGQMERQGLEETGNPSLSLIDHPISWQVLCMPLCLFWLSLFPTWLHERGCHWLSLCPEFQNDALLWIPNSLIPSLTVLGNKQKKNVLVN